ncbi:MAG: WecB/TagA/CpsF family glycosyltransferase [Chloroflexi bacterium]|nr:WecB/TagA/CpsF family glycosyltransferase [Chloroflexota bacterium]
MDSVNILGVRVDNVTTAETLALIERFIAKGQPHQIATVNPEFVMRAQQDGAFHVVLEECDLSLPDGAGLLWAARLLGHPLRERVTGSDTVPLIARLSAARGYRLYLLGAAPGVAEQAAAVLQRDYPGLQIVGTYAGSPDPTEEDEIVARIVAASPDVLFVAYGAPRQDVWIHRNLARLGVPVCMGVGGTFDFIAGVAVRAPLWMRRAGLEWLHRLWREPWRWRRMLALPRFAWRVLRQRFSFRRGRN